jgi:nickel transport protein
MRLRRILALLVTAGALTLGGQSARAHSIHYQVEPKGLSVRIFYDQKDPASYSEYEIYGPGDKEPSQIGRTDRQGYVSFVPDRAGMWKVKVLGESSHGFHGATVDVKVDKALNLESFNKPLLARSTKVITGISLVFGIFGVYALWAARRKK